MKIKEQQRKNNSTKITKTKRNISISRNINKVTFAPLAVAMAVALVFAIAPALVTPVTAAIQCTNPGGGHPQGNCQGPNEQQNPSGRPPAGQNKIIIIDTGDDNGDNGDDGDFEPVDPCPIC